ncbi:MAG: hypoxanthine phosphoribosyltransferase [Armatimonadota bacterium]
MHERVHQLAAEIDDFYEGREITVVIVLKGAFVFAADLIRHLQTPLSVTFIHVQSYGNGTSSSGRVDVVLEMGDAVEDQEVLIVEDIVDTGRTANFLLTLYYEHGARDVRICTLLDKPSRREIDVDLDFVGFAIPDVFVVGCGIDYAQRYRNLPDICALE